MEALDLDMTYRLISKPDSHKTTSNFQPWLLFNKLEFRFIGSVFTTAEHQKIKLNFWFEVVGATQASLPQKD